MKWRILLSILSSTVLLSGCATAGTSSATPSAQSSNTNTVSSTYKPAANADNQTVVTQYVPVPVPGQLMPKPNTTIKKSAPTTKTATAAVDRANKQATQLPQSSQFFNSMMTYDYMPGALYTVYTAPMKITDIALAPGEKLVSEAAGDTLRWQIAQTYSGAGDNLTQHILVKPNQPDLQNTMVITTDQRVYHLVLISTDESYMASVNWNYPGNLVNYESHPNTSSLGKTGGNTPNLSNLDFNYSVALLEGSKPAWYPVRIFNDGKQTYIQLPPNYSASQLPVLYVADENGNYASMVNWRYRAPYIIVDVVVQNAKLQSGVEKTGQTVVSILHT